MVYICMKFGIANYDEYSLVYDLEAEDGSSVKTATLRRVTSPRREKLADRIVPTILGSIATTHR